MSSLQQATSLVAPILTQIVWDVLECAKDAGDADVIAACRRIIVGHGDDADMRLVLAFVAQDQTAHLNQVLGFSSETTCHFA